MKLFAALLFGSPVAAESPAAAMCPETHPFKDMDGDQFCCEGPAASAQCGDEIACTTEKCNDYSANDTCPPSYPFMKMQLATVNTVNGSYTTSACCKTAEACGEGIVTCLKEGSGTCESYVAPFPCPTKACWLYNASTATCSMKAECATLQCGATGFDVTFQSALFDLEDDQSLVTFDGGIASPVWDTTQWTKTVALGSTGVTYDINTTTNDISFSILLAIVGNDMRTRTDDIQDNLINLGTKEVITTPFGAGVVFKCTYPMSVDISTEDGGTYTVHGASVVDTYSAIGSLAAGFQMVLNNGEDPSFTLGTIVDLAVTWTVTSMPTLTFYLDSCTVTHGATTIGIVKEGCYASELDVKHESSLQAFSYKVFKGVGEASSTQTIECTINICETNNCGIPTANQCPSAGDDGFYKYTI